VRYAKIEPGRFGDDRCVGPHAADNVLHADRGELFVGDRGDDRVAA
jgi:hypothetical protein